MLADIPARRFTTLDDVVASALFLLSDDAAHITGETLTVDGGQALVAGHVPPQPHPAAAMSDGWAWAQGHAGARRWRRRSPGATGSRPWPTTRPTGRPGRPPSAARAFRPRCTSRAAPSGSARAERLAGSRGGEALVDRWLIYDGDRVAAVYRGEQLDGYTYMTGHAAVHLD